MRTEFDIDWTMMTMIPGDIGDRKWKAIAIVFGGNDCWAEVVVVEEEEEWEAEVH